MINPDKTAHRAVDACGGTYTPEQYANGYAEGHAAALDAAIEAVKKPDALMNELLEALILMEAEKADYMRINFLGDPAKEHTNKLARAVIAKATGDA